MEEGDQEEMKQGSPDDDSSTMDLLDRLLDTGEFHKATRAQTKDFELSFSCFRRCWRLRGFHDGETRSFWIIAWV